MSETRRTVETVFTAKDAGYGAVVGRLSSAFQSSAHHLEHFRHKLGEFRREQGFTTVAMLGLGYGLGSWIEKAKEAQAEFLGTQRSLAGVLSGALKFPAATSEIERYRRAMALSAEVTEQAEEAGARYNMGFQDVAATYKSTAAAAGLLGISLRQAEQLTESELATAKRFGVEGERAAMAVARAIQTGTVRGFEPFDIRLRAVLGNMHKLTQAQRFEHVQRALRGSMEIADAMSTGIGASLNRARVAVTSVFRQATGPLFKEVADSLDKWARHIREVREQGKPLVDIFANKLVGAFHTLQSVTSFLHDHWGALAAIFGSIKAMDLAKSIGGGIAGLGGALGTGGLGATLGVVGSGFTRLASTTVPLIGALAALKVGLDGLLGFIDAKLDESAKKDQKASSFSSAFGTAQKLAGLGVLDEKQARIARRTVEEMKRAGVVSAAGALDQSAIAQAVTRLSTEEREGLVDRLGIRVPGLPVGQMAGTQFADAIMKSIGPLVQAFSTVPAVAAVTDDKNLKFAKTVQNFYGGITVNQKFEDQDPDRVFVRFKQGLQDEIVNRTQALTAEPQGD